MAHASAANPSPPKCHQSCPIPRSKSRSCRCEPEVASSHIWESVLRSRKAIGVGPCLRILPRHGRKSWMWTRSGFWLHPRGPLENRENPQVPSPQVMWVHSKMKTKTKDIQQETNTHTHWCKTNNYKNQVSHTSTAPEGIQHRRLEQNLHSCNQEELVPSSQLFKASVGRYTQQVAVQSSLEKEAYRKKTDLVPSLLGLQRQGETPRKKPRKNSCSAVWATLEK